MVPVKPSEAKAAVVEPNDSLGVGIYKTYVLLPILLFKFIRYLFTAQGEINKDFGRDICRVECPEPETET